MSQCSFCHKPEEDCSVLIKAPYPDPAYICDECAYVCVTLANCHSVLLSIMNSGLQVVGGVGYRVADSANDTAAPPATQP